MFRDKCVYRFKRFNDGDQMKIAVDFDRTLSYYEGSKTWKMYEFGPPIPAMYFRVKEWVALGHTVVIFTARVAPHGLNYDIEGVRKAIQDWLEAHDLPRLEVTCIKDPSIDQIWDDKAVSVQENSGLAVSFLFENPDF